MVQFSWQSRLLIDRFRNNFTQPSLAYVVEPANWVISTDGAAIVAQIKEQFHIRTHLTTTTAGLPSCLIHYGSLPVAKQYQKKIIAPHNHHKSIVSVFHLDPSTYLQSALPLLSKLHIHTACQATAQQLRQLGLNSQHITVIPLGVDTSIFHEHTRAAKIALREKLGIPPDALVIGSFQKDGVGWGEGVEPKLIKGPDILVQAVAALKATLPVFVLLTGPARGYVKKHLAAANIPFKHIGYTTNLADVATMYGALDMYLITSRLEGGPKQILEAWASGVPVISTAVGMIPDIATHMTDALIAKTANPEAIAALGLQIAKDTHLQQQLTANASQTVQSFSWPRIAKRYYHELYQPLL